ncbi:MAG: cell wall-binding repeat-containing protein, partial [Actinomycetia bacterium]|nr:cell wall-binding repeat-containing protein [Actinomycetes bacterium]
GTAASVASETITVLGDAYTGGAFMATGANFPDALAASPIMFKKGMPLILVDASGGFSLPAGVSKVKILGGTYVVPAAAETALGGKFDGRLAGSSRYATAKIVAEYGVSLGMSWNDVGIATGEDFPDALCAGPLVGSKNAVLLLTSTNTLSTDAASALGANKAAVDEYYLFGGLAALSQNLRAQIAETLASAPNVHALPAVTCTWAGCHDTDLATIHIAKGCSMCHGTVNTPSADCVGCHGTTAHDVDAIHAAITSVPNTPAENCNVCHGTATLTLHKGGCGECHASSDTRVKNAIKAGGATCESCHDFATVHVVATESHTISGEDCFTSTCHGTDVAKMHTMDFRGTGDAPPGCAACHAVGKTPSTDCISCHVNLASKHDAASAHASVQDGLAATKSAGCTTCHGTNLMTVLPADNSVTHRSEHVGCTCHAYGEVRGVKECMDCHVKPMDATAPHPYHVGAHDAVQSEIAANSAGCVSCHGSNILAVLPADNPITHQVEHDGCSCHAYHEADGQTACEDCHVKPMDATAPHPYHVGAHASLEASIAGETSAACTACHGTNLLDVSAGSAHIAGEHKSCSCHAYGEATPANTECADCHKDAYAPHGFVDGVSHTGTGWVAASGHSTTTLGKRGVYEDFSAMPITDSNGATITAAWPFPTRNVFWSADATNAPAGAVKGLTKDSVITCEDCHSALVSNELVGPHGGATFADFGLDPAFPGSFDTAYLWGTGTTGNPGYVSGVAQYAPGGSTDAEKEELANWQLQMPVDDGDPTNTTLVAGPATISEGTVICVKCHDLYNAGTGDKGYASYAHEHHADRPVQNFGKFSVGDGGTMTTVTVVAESAAAAIAEVSGATTSTIVVAAALNRETAGACRDCHVAVPHGWKRPRLIVFASDTAPYNAGPSVYEGEDKSFPLPSGSVSIGSGQMNGLSSRLGPTIDGTGDTQHNNWTTTQCNACGHHTSTDLSAGAWK